MGTDQIIEVTSEAAALIDGLAALAFEAFRSHAPNWLTTSDAARGEVVESLEPGRRSWALVDARRQPMAWIAAVPQSDGRVWEIHPIAVRRDLQGQGYGRLLVDHLAEAARAAGALTLFAGTSDTTGDTSLFGVDVYAAPALALAGAVCDGDHAFNFWLKMGFSVVGIMPDAEGEGMPSIHFARRVGS